MVRYGSVYLARSGLVCGAFCLFPSAFLLIGAGTDPVKQPQLGEAYCLKRMKVLHFLSSQVLGKIVA